MSKASPKISTQARHVPEVERPAMSRETRENPQDLRSPVGGEDGIGLLEIPGIEG
jgi:hypothetical protein